MAGRSPYSDEDKAVVYTSLVTNDWNVKKTARETLFPEQTVRNWAKKWKKGDGLPRAEAVEYAASTFLSQAIELRDKLLASLAQDLEDNALKPGEKITAMGVLDDKIARAQGLARKGDTSVHVHLPSADEIVGVLTNLAQTAMIGAMQRHNEIVDAEIMEQPKALPA